MQSIIIVCVLLFAGFVCQAQLNYEGSPLTETIDYTAQESQSSRLKARQDYQRFEIADGRAISLSKHSFTPSAIDPLATEETKHSSSYVNDDGTKYDEQWKKTTEATNLLNNGSPLIEANRSLRTGTMSRDMTEPARDIKPSTEGLSEASLAKPDMESRAETRQLREYPIQYSHTRHHKSVASQETPQAYNQPTPRAYVSPEQSSITRNLTPHSTNPINQASGEALNQFLNSRTPEESETALQSYLSLHERTSLNSAQQPSSINDEQTRQNGNRRVTISDTLDNEISENYENPNSPQQIDNTRTLPVAVSSDSNGQIAYLSRGQYMQQSQQQYPYLRWKQFGVQSRRDGFHAVPSMRRYPMYRGPMRSRLNPWAQSRIAPGTPIYHPKGAIFPGPPGLSNPGIKGHWKEPIEVIYTKPPGPVESSQTALSNPPVSYENANKWFPDSDHQPSQKDIYYSQLYAQSYDPHYYNYIAKTGKIKPWLYGKLGKNEEKSIWWELFSGFKNHGMKNMMNPMFLLGMTIPTLTLMLTALVQKRSIGRANTGDMYDPRELIEKYEPQIRAALLAYENQSKEGTEVEARKDVKSVQKRSVGPAPAGIERFEDFFLTQQDISADAILANDKRLEDGKMQQRSIGPAPSGVNPFEEFFLTHQDLFAKAILEYEKQSVERRHRDKIKKEKVGKKLQ